jgi:DNA-binding response OmpR family regulator
MRTMRGEWTPPKVLIVEDNPESSFMIEMSLADARLDLRIVDDGDQALAMARDWAPDLVLLDLNIPGPDGFEVCRQLRAYSDVYVIMLTGRAGEADKLAGLSAGADDYVTKPFSPRELAARVEAVLRRPHALVHAAGSNQQNLGSLDIDLSAREVRIDGSPVDLTKTEFDLLAALTENVRQVRSRDQLREQVWGGSWLADEHAVDVHMSNLRRKLRAGGQDEMITTVRGIGYRFGPPRKR